MKISVIGAGSTYTPELIEGLIAQREILGLRDVVLMDIDAERLAIVGGLAQRMVAAAGQPFRVELTTSRLQAIAGSSFVLTQLRVGGQEARHHDTVLCLNENLIGQETTGAAGFAKALRTIPVILEICEEMRRTAPDAFLINFTNPAGIVTEAALKYGGVRAIGLCNSPFGMRYRIGKRYGVSYEAVDLDYVGLNHLGWVRRVWVNGKDVTHEVLPVRPNRAANIPEMELNSDFMAALNMQVNSYLRYFYLEDEMIAHLQGQDRTRAQQVMDIDRQLLEKYKNPNLSEKPQELSQRGGAHYSTVAVSVIQAIVTNSGARHVVNVQNNGALPELPPECVVEVTASVDGRGAHAMYCGKLEPEIRGLVQHVKAYEELTVEAAVHNDYNKALLALVNNPLVNSVNKAKRLLDQFIALHDLPLVKP